MRSFLQWLFFGGLTPIFLLSGGLLYLFFLRARPLICLRRTVQTLTEPAPQAGVSPFRAVMLALAGTLGVGNIVGVANALFIGGAGALFWMWASAFVAMLLKYAEIVLAVRHRRQRGDGFFGGAYYYIRDCLLFHGKFRLALVIPAVFSFFLILNALSMGCVIQVNAVSASFAGVLGVPPIVMGVFLLVLTLPVIVRGSTGISALTEYLVPVMSLGYVILSLAVLILRREAIGDALCSVFREAFTVRGATGGVVGFLSSGALRIGTMRGLLSNEAGCGTAPTAHASANAKCPASQGLWGIFEVFADTILLCTATALVILVNYGEAEAFGATPVMMTIRAYSVTLGAWSELFFAVAIFCFGYATILCWANYGAEGVRSLSSRRWLLAVYYAAFGACIPIGAMAAPGMVWSVADLSLATLTAINVPVLLCLRHEVREETERFFGGRKERQLTGSTEQSQSAD